MLLVNEKQNVIYLIGLCETRFAERNVSIPALVAEAGCSFHMPPFRHLNNAQMSSISAF